MHLIQVTDKILKLGSHGVQNGFKAVLRALKPKWISLKHLKQHMFTCSWNNELVLRVLLKPKWISLKQVHIPGATSRHYDITGELCCLLEFNTWNNAFALKPVLKEQTFLFH